MDVYVSYCIIQHSITFHINIILCWIPKYFLDDGAFVERSFQLMINDCMLQSAGGV